MGQRAYDKINLRYVESSSPSIPKGTESPKENEGQSKKDAIKIDNMKSAKDNKEK
jgi:hypothetical protein